jgi:hypothetical protein
MLAEDCMPIPFQIHRRIPFIRRPFWQRDLALRDRDQALSERDQALRDCDATQQALDHTLEELAAARAAVACDKSRQAVDRAISTCQSSCLSTRENLPLPSGTTDFKKFGARFITDFPTDANSFNLQSGSWKYDYDKLSHADIMANIHSDGRPKYCADTFPGFRDFRIIEVGPSDGYNTAGLELHGAKDIISIEGNAGAFLRCLIMKNVFQLKAKFLLGDFIQYLDDPKTAADLIYASGVLYHLTDPVEFIRRCSEISPNLFLWTFYHDPKVINDHEYERMWFAPSENYVKVSNGHSFTYHRRYYEMSIVESEKYAGGLKRFANWLSYDDLFTAIEMAGYRVDKVIEDEYSGIPALNILAHK